MDPRTLAATIRPSADALYAHARAAGVDAAVPSCPEWRVEQLVAHMGSVHRWAAAVVTGGEYVKRRDMEPAPPPGEAVLDWGEVQAGVLLAALDGADAERPSWVFPGLEPGTVGFWCRRQAHETAVHAADAALAAGADPAAHLTPELASDGIDELLVAFVPRMLGAVTLPGSLHVHCTDTEGEWLVVPEGDGVVVTREHAKGDAALRGPAADLLLRLSNRAGGGEVIGDESVLDAWGSAARF